MFKRKVADSKIVCCVREALVVVVVALFVGCLLPGTVNE